MCLLQRISTEHRLNDSQRAALAAVTGRHLTLIQGPPGTGKTSLAIALLRFMRELYQGRSLVAAPSNAAADNIARRIRGGQLEVGRYGFRAAADLEGISTVAIAEKREGKADSRDAVKRRKAVERKILSEDVNVACGTLMSVGLPHLWDLRIISS